MPTASSAERRPNRNQQKTRKARPSRATARRPEAAAAATATASAGRGPASEDFEPEITEDDVLIPVAGILDVLDNYAFVRTSGYLPGANDVYVSLGQVKKYNLRKGDAVVGAIRQPREGDNSRSPEVQRDRPHRLGQRPARRRGREPGRVRQADPALPERAPSSRDRAGQALDRIIDLVSPIGKGQRGLIVVAAQGGQDARAPGHRQRDLEEQP